MIIKLKSSYERLFIIEVENLVLLKPSFSIQVVPPIPLSTELRVVYKLSARSPIYLWNACLFSVCS